MISEQKHWHSLCFWYNYNADSQYDGYLKNVISNLKRYYFATYLASASILQGKKSFMMSPDDENESFDLKKEKKKTKHQKFF